MYSSGFSLHKFRDGVWDEEAHHAFDQISVLCGGFPVVGPLMMVGWMNKTLENFSNTFNFY